MLGRVLDHEQVRLGFWVGPSLRRKLGKRLGKKLRTCLASRQTLRLSI